MIAKSTNASLFDSNQDTVVVCELSHEIDIEWFHESGIGNRYLQVIVFVFDFLGGDESFVQSGTNAQNGDAVLASLAPRAGFGFDHAAFAANDAALSNGKDFACSIKQTAVKNI